MTELSRWVTDVSSFVFVGFLLWVLWGVLQYLKMPGDRSRGTERADRYPEKQWTKRPTLRR